MEWKGGKHKKWQRLENGSSLLISFCIFPRRTQQLERISQQTEDRCGPHLTWGEQPWQAEGWSSNTGSVTCHMSLDESLQLWVPIYPHPQETVKSFFLTVLSWFHAFFYANLGGRDFFFLSWTTKLQDKVNQELHKSGLFQFCSCCPFTEK